MERGDPKFKVIFGYIEALSQTSKNNKINKIKAWLYSSVAEGLPSMQGALGSILFLGQLWEGADRDGRLRFGTWS